jgi:hypothetical protein
MNSQRPPHRRTLAGIAAIALLAAACGGSSAPTTSASASSAAATTPSPAASAATSPALTASPPAAGSPGADPAATLSIAAPYTLAPLEGAQADQFEAGLKASLGAMASIVQVGTRQVKKSGANDGLLLAMAFPGVPVPGSFLDAIAASAGGSNAKVTSRTIQGQDVRLIEGTGTNIAAYLHGSTIVFAYGQTADESLAIITAVIQASE